MDEKKIISQFHGAGSDRYVQEKDFVISHFFRTYEELPADKVPDDQSDESLHFEVTSFIEANHLFVATEDDKRAYEHEAAADVDLLTLQQTRFREEAIEKSVDGIREILQARNLAK